MKNLNKKIGVVALAAMMLVGGVAASGIRVQAAPSGPLEIGNQRNIDDYNFVRRICRENNVKVAKFSSDSRVINSFVKDKFAANEGLKNRLLDLSAGFEHGQRDWFEEYIVGLKNDKNKKYRIYRVKFGFNEYIIEFNK